MVFPLVRRHIAGTIVLRWPSSCKIDQQATNMSLSNFSFAKEGKKLGSIGLRRCVVERLNREEELEDGGGLFGFRITAGGRTKR